MSSAIAGVGTPGAAPSTTDRTGSSALGKDAFLKLLVAQLSNQDPTSPADPNQFVAQLAQFSSLEQMTTMNSTLQSLLTAQSSTSQISAVGMVGKVALCQTKQQTLPADGTATLIADLAAASASTTLVVTDAAGKAVAKVDLGAKPAGQSKVDWDGTSSSGAHVPAGSYTLSITATDSAGKNISLNQTARRRIDGVSFQDGTPELLMGLDQVPLTDVLEVVEP